MASLLVVLCWVVVEDKISGWTLTFLVIPLLGFFSKGPELDSSNVLLQLTVAAFVGSLGGTLKAFGSMPAFPELEGERVPGRLRPSESRILNPNSRPHFSSCGTASLFDTTANVGALPLVASPGGSEGLLNAVLRVSEGMVSGELSRGHKSSSKTWWGSRE